MTGSRNNPSIITLLTDFGVKDAYVGLMKGVILGINPAAQIVDLSHSVPPQDTMCAALILRNAIEFFPPGTVHLAVVDPGVGSARKPLVLRCEQATFVGPDNGVLSLAAGEAGDARAYLLRNERYFRPRVSQTFHGRDIFAPVAAHLTLGIDPADCGPPVDSIVELSSPPPRLTATGVQGEVIYIDRFGNLVTNIESAALGGFPAGSLSVTIGSQAVTGPVTSYAAVDEGTPLALIGSWNVLEVAIRNGNAARELRAGLGTRVMVTVRDSTA